MDYAQAATGTHAIGFWKNSLVRRFFLLSLLVASVPLLVTVFVYDRMTAGLVSDMANERAQQNLSQIRNSLYHYSRQHVHALEAISELPDIPQLFQTSFASFTQSLTQNLIHFDIDRPEMYGALFFDADWQLVNTVPGQSASGYPYWGEGQFDVESLPKTQFGAAMLIGPKPASPGKSAWYLMVLPVQSPQQQGRVSGYIGFQLRLASLTSYLASSPGDDVVLCRGNGDASACFDALGRLVPSPKIRSAELPLFSDWSLVNVSITPPVLERDQERILVLIMAGLVLLLVSAFFYFLVKRVRRRVFPLIDAADAVSEGHWKTTLPISGNDEISLLARAFNRMTSHLDSLLLARGEAERKAVWGEFATGIAHEIRNPLATIKVCVQTLPDSRPEDAELQSLMVGEIDRINQLITDLLEYARPPDPETKAVCLQSIVRRLASLVSPMAKERGITLHVDCDKASQVFADENQIQQILMNLLINALDASTPGSNIGLRAVERENSLCLEVSDEGCGMDAHQIATVSQPFYTTKTTGTGLGLSVSHRLAEMNKAALEFYSQPGKGTQVVLRFKRESICEPDYRICS